MTVNPLNYYTMLQSYALPSLYGVNPTLIEPVLLGQNDAAAYTNTVNADQVEISGLGQLTSALTGFQTAMQGLESSSQVSGNITSAAQSFVSAYNSLLGTLNSLTGSTGSLASDPVAAQLSQDLQNTLSATYNSGGSTTSLAQLGITVQSNGTLALDSNALQAAYTSDPTGTVAVLNQAAQAFDTLSTNYAGPGGSLILDSQGLQQDIYNQQLTGGAASNAASVAQDTWSADYAALLSVGYQNQLMANEYATLVQANYLGSAGSSGSSWAALSTLLAKA